MESALYVGIDRKKEEIKRRKGNGQGGNRQKAVGKEGREANGVGKEERGEKHWVKVKKGQHLTAIHAFISVVFRPARGAWLR